MNEVLVKPVGKGRLTCRDAVMAAFVRLEARVHRSEFRLEEVVAEARAT